MATWWRSAYASPVRACSSCGRENPDDARFCMSCAAELPDAAPSRDSRKTVTVVFCDVTGSTAMGERLDPESLGKVMGRYFQTMRSEIERHGGTVEKFIGDAVMAVFGVPTLHEDDALRAVRAAEGMRAALVGLNLELQTERGVSIQTRTGVNTGEVLVGVHSSSEGVLSGDAVNVAARLEQAAAPGEILLGWQTFRLTRDAVEVEPVEPLDLKGKSEPVPAFRLIRSIPGVEGHARRMESPMVGRDSELHLLAQAFDRSTQERACVLFTMLGSAGVGKSRLSEEFLSRAGDARVLRGRCLHYGEGITYWPVVDVLTQAAGIDEGDTAEEARGKLDAVLDGAPDAEIIATRLMNLLGLGGQAAPDETFWAIRRIFEHLASTEPLIVILDDIQWAEPTLLDLIEHVADWSREAPDPPALHGTPRPAGRSARVGRGQDERVEHPPGTAPAGDGRGAHREPPGLCPTRVRRAGAHPHGGRREPALRRRDPRHVHRARIAHPGRRAVGRHERSRGGGGAADDLGAPDVASRPPTATGAHRPPARFGRGERVPPRGVAALQEEASHDAVRRSPDGSHPEGTDPSGPHRDPGGRRVPVPPPVDPRCCLPGDAQGGSRRPP